MTEIGTLVERPSVNRQTMLLQVSLILFTAELAPPARAQEPAAPGGSPAGEVVFVGAGDIAKCEMLGGAAATARLLDRIPGTVFTLGDNAYASGSAKDFATCYGPTWGRHKARTRPAPGNHDVVTENGRYYYEYFAESAGPPGLGYYSYDLGSWHVIALNSTIDVGANSPQGRWLKADLASHPTDCIVAYWHAPFFSSGPHSTDRRLHAFWRVLYEAGADIVLNGHDHIYERFAPQNPSGKADPEHGIRAFVVGTGGGGVYEFKRRAQNSEVSNNRTYGVLKLTLGPGRYAWEFVPVAGQAFTDMGTGTCSPQP